MIYTGIGSRQTPADILTGVSRIAERLAMKGWTLRSGAAWGADSAFERGCDAAKGKKEIFLPWRYFNSRESEFQTVSQEAMEIAAKHHPAWHRCDSFARRLHGRNVYQVLGFDLKTPTNVVICWTQDGQLVGGTATALRIADDHDIPIINFGEPQTRALASMGVIMRAIESAAMGGSYEIARSV